MQSHIVRLLESSFASHPQLHLEYVPLGSLEDVQGVSYDEAVSVVSQCLSALVYLHGREPPIAHRDIKPANILVQHRLDGNIYVKLGDFGLSRDGFEMMTFCGTPMYLAPEVHYQSQHNSSQRGYTSAVDIWSLGVVACELLYGLPRYNQYYRDNGVAWCKQIIARLQDTSHKTPSHLGRLLLDTMVIMAPNSRFSAGDCLDSMAGLLADEKSGHQTPTPDSYFEDDCDATLEYTLQKYSAKSPTTVIYQPRSQTGIAMPSTYVRSGAPSPATLLLDYDTVPSASATTVASSRSTTKHHVDGNELAHFMQDYSADPCNSLYVGSALASQLGEDNEWASEFSEDSAGQDQASQVGLQADTGAQSLRTSLQHSVPREGSENKALITEICPDDFDEMAAAERLLQAIGQDSSTL